MELKKQTMAELDRLKIKNNFETYDEVIDLLISKQSNTIEGVLNSVNVDDDSLKDLFSTDNLDKKSDISVEQISAISKAVTFAKRYDNELILDYVDRFLSYSISKQRKGRSEFVESFKAKILEPLGLGLGGINNEDK